MAPETNLKGGDHPHGQESQEGRQEGQDQGTEGLAPSAPGEAALLADLRTLRGRFRILLGSAAAPIDELHDAEAHFRALTRMLQANVGRRTLRQTDGPRGRVVYGHL